MLDHELRPSCTSCYSFKLIALVYREEKRVHFCGKVELEEIRKIERTDHPVTTECLRSMQIADTTSKYLL